MTAAGDFDTVPGHVARVLQSIASRGDALTIGAVYCVARDVLSRRLGMVCGSSFPYSSDPAGPMRVEIRDGTSPGESVLYAIDGNGRRVMRFDVLTCRDFEAKEAIEEVLGAFAEQTARVAA